MKLTDSTFQIYAAKLYDVRRAAGIEEFNEDLKRFQYLKRLFKKYTVSGELNTRLILNHLIIIYNMFGPEATILLMHKLSMYQSSLTPFLVFMNHLPEVIQYDDKKIITSNINMDKAVIKELRNLNDR